MVETGTTVRIDEEKCNGCGLCMPACAEGALKIVNGKAKVVNELCDGMGACLGKCPQDAITIIERPAGKFGEKHHDRGGCPGSATRTASDFAKTHSHSRPPGKNGSELRQWPVQLSLLSPDSPHFDNCDLLVCADCVPFADADFHTGLLKGRTAVVGCPKLDDAEFYIDKLSEIFRRNEVKSVTVANMEVPCCFGLMRIAEEALKKAGKQIPVEHRIVKISG